MNVLITGTTSGIGMEFAKLLAKKQYNLILVDKIEDDLEKQKNEFKEEYNISIETICKDLSIDSSAQEIFDEVQEKNINVDILINNAGFGVFGRFTDISLEWQKKLLNVNMSSLMQLSYLFGRKMVENGRGKILNVASIAAFQAGPYMSMYYASKAFVLSFSEGIAKELEGTGVTVTAVCPGPTDTNFENAAKMVDSLMFKKLKVDSPKIVAKKGIKALQKNKIIYIVSWYNKLIVFLNRLITKKISRNLSCYINIGRKKY